MYGGKERRRSGGTLNRTVARNGQPGKKQRKIAQDHKNIYAEQTAEFTFIFFKKRDKVWRSVHLVFFNTFSVPVEIE